MAMPAAPLSLPHCHAHIAPGALVVVTLPGAKWPCGLEHDGFSLQHILSF